jgi:hypothetical protein
VASTRRTFSPAVATGLLGSAIPFLLYKKSVELADTAGALEQDGEADDHTVLLGDSGEARRDLVRGQLDCVGVRCELSPVHRLVHRGAALEPFQRLTFGRLRGPNRCASRGDDASRRPGHSGD